ncbi:MAG: wax ester/triacylglycerol synthase family O-acyltransferase [Thermoanaerobaculia bacterium]
MEVSPREVNLPLPVAPGERGTPLSGVDVAWLRMDHPSNLMHIHGVIALDGEVDREAAARVLRERLLIVSRFRQRVALQDGRLVWAEAADFDLARHLVEERIAEPGGDRELAAAIEPHLGRPLDRRHPLWEFRLFQGYRGGTVVFGRLHHSIGDGVALMVVLMALTDLAPGGPSTVAPPGSTEIVPGNPFLDILNGPAGTLAAARAAAEQVMPETMRLMLAPVEAFRRTSAFVRGAGMVHSLGRLVARSRDPGTPFKGELGVAKRVAWSRELPLDEIKTLGKSLGATINDVLNSAMAGGLRRYMAAAGEPPRDLSFRCAMPVNLRPLEEMAELGNRFGLIFLSLPVGIADPLARLAELQRRASALKRSAEPLVVFSLLRAMGVLPQFVHTAMVKIFASKATAVFTNVPGPRAPLYLAGRKIRELYFWVPQAGRLGLGVSIFSYAGHVRMGVVTDAGLVPDPERIIDGFRAELDALADAV